ncbi:MAG: hypothetical protein A3B07_00180 [Candidatus Yonathbacteria bacterium RIFCSPLOWO2_01_FULL_43_27]|uniref:Uncharacterized protein n=2 Tax=Parcubacteria group TaxID=1794811 RepID=A0A1G2SDY6_9BACT|nr:MAG: hypothetical protein UW78_C0004G0026 [Candidatus Azambacteria bacterium GW2011_GWA1_44_9]OHA78726.1 MAG: hypothetical protein A2658_01160 [Candidatus Yonathbacteria bacterium RIFCSPHIGHO2_01_FULL_44_19]OHA83175.1 MAG: hypothetical protein A3B07_00180 [Candidatus Yonathbacteria bacterium RIFCSPLOWO2_01_FULL_43_27]
MLFIGGDSIRFRGQYFKAHVGIKESKPFLCTPIVYNDEENCGVGIIVEWNRVQKWGMYEPRDYIASWRAGEILRELRHINSITVRGAYFAASRSLNSKEEQYCTTPVIEGIGEESYHKIMSLPIPNKIVQVVLDDRKNKSLNPNLYPLTEEIEAGTLAWRGEFSEAGVLTPEQFRTNKKRHEEIKLETDKHLRSMINDIKNIDLTDIGICIIRSTLATLFEKKVNEEYPHYVLVAFAVIMSDAKVAHIQSRAGYKMFEKISRWVSRTSGYPRFSPFNIVPKKKGVLSPQESFDLLQKLVSQYYPADKN